jgi:hypothetical protein
MAVRGGDELASDNFLLSALSSQMRQAEDRQPAAQRV